MLYPLAASTRAGAPYAQLTRCWPARYAATTSRANTGRQPDREEALEWLVNVRLYPAEKSAQRLQFYDAMGAYVINYNLGQDMAKAYVEHQGATRAEHWAAFRDLMASPRVPSALLAGQS